MSLTPWDRVIALTDGSGAIAAFYTYDPSGTTLTASGAPQL